MDNLEFIEICQRMVEDYYESNEQDKKIVDKDDVTVVWISKTIQNNKAMLIAMGAGDNKYFEVTHNGDTEEFYLDVYQKIEKVTYKIDHQDGE